jgi:hypothetical protein
VNNHLEPLFPSAPTRSTCVVLFGFTAALCWWVAMVGVVNGAAGALFLGLPILATIGTVLAIRGRGRHGGKHVKSLRHPHRRAPAWNRRTVVILGGFTAVLCWWLGVIAVIVSGGGAQAFLAFLTVPLLATMGTVLAATAGRTAG